jgi:hypothetical protein
MRGRVSAVIMLVAIAVAGCDGDSKGGSCAQPDACGGDVVGTWKIVDSCIDFELPPIDSDFCPQATASVADIALSGGVTYDADLTYSSTLTMAFSFVIKYPLSCFSSGGQTITCAEFNDALQEELAANPNPDFQSYTCASAGSFCNCTAVATPMTQTESGTYTTTSGRITTTSSGDSSTDKYCVQGDTLHLISDQADAEVSGVIDLARQ